MKCLAALLGAWALLAGYGCATAPKEPATAKASAHSELVSATTDDKITLHGALWTPAGNKARVGIVLAAGTGGEFYGGWLGWLGEHLADAGYLALSMNRRDHGDNFGYYELEPSAMDHRYAVDLLMARGVEAIVLAGQSYGTVTVPYYMQATDDKRVKGIILYAAHGDLRAGSVISSAFVGPHFPQKDPYDRIVARAREKIAAGRGDEVFLFPPILPDTRPIPHTYKVFLNKRGPDSKAAPIELVKQVNRPILAIRDPADPYAPTLPPAQQQLEAANSNLQYVLLSDIHGGKMLQESHGFVGREEEVFRITKEWLTKQGLTP